MRKIRLMFILILSIAALPAICLGAVGTNWIEQWGITWTFDKNISTDGAGDTYQYGQFANGDYWVVGPVNIIGIDPLSQDVSGRTMNGSMINPSPADGKYPGHHGWDSALGYYRAEDNVALGVFEGSPLVVPSNSSLLSSITHEEDVSNQIKVIAILTVLLGVPAENSFRPPYCGSDKTICHNISDMSYDSLGSLAITPHTPVLSDIEAEFEKPWVDYWPGSPGKSFHPTDSMETYGRDISIDLEEGALMLQLDFSNKQKETLMIRMVQLGIDNYGVTQDTRGNLVWVPDGGHAMGRKFPIMFAGTVLNDADMLAIADKSGDYIYDGEYGPGNPPPDYIHFGEDASTFYVTSNDIYPMPYKLFGRYRSGQYTVVGNVKVTNGSKIVEGIGTSWSSLTQPCSYFFGVAGDNKAHTPSELESKSYIVDSIDSDTQITLTEVYNGNTDLSGTAEYVISYSVYYGHYGREFVSSDLGIPEWGIRHSLYPMQSNPAWVFASYRHANANIWMGWVLAAQIMGMKSAWNHDALFDYTDRHDAIALIIKAGMESSEGSFVYDGYANKINWRAFASAFTGEMWDTYRADYPSVWTPAPGSEPEPDPEDPIVEVQPEADDITVENTVMSSRNNVIKAGSNSSAIIQCDMKEAGNLSVIVYDSKGKEIKVLFNGNKEAGRYEFTWSAADVGSGIYIVNMVSGGYKETKKIAVVK